jgi:hypothetical protein
VTLVTGAEVKENPGAEVVVAGGVLSSMMLTLDTVVGDEACTFTPRGDVGLEGDEDTENGREEDGTTTGEGLNASAGLNAGVDEHALVATVTVTVESNRTVSMPSVPLELNVDKPFDTTGLGVSVNAGAEGDEVIIPPKPKLDEELAVGVPDKGVKEMELDGTIPPKLNVLVGAEELNWRLFRLMTGGEGAGALRLTTEGLPGTCGAAP